MPKLDEVEKNMLNTFNNNIENEDEDICYLCKNIIEDGDIANMDVNNIEEDEKDLTLCRNCYYSGKCSDCGINMKNRIELIYLIDNYESIDTCTICFLEKEKKLNKLKSELISELKPYYKIGNNNNNKVNMYIKPSLLYKFNNLKNKIKNNSLNKDINIKLKGKTYIFKSNNIKKEKKVYVKSNYYENYKFKITDDDINEQDNIIKNNKIKNETFWKNYNEEKIKSMKNIEKVFKDDPIIKCNNFNEKYKNKTLEYIYKNINLELNEIEKEYTNFKNIETYYNKLKEDQNIISIFKDNNSIFNKLFTEYENNRINEYNTLKNIGELIVNDKINKNEKKELNSIHQNTRSSRIIKQSKRVYILEEFVNIRNIALSGISNWLRDTSDDNFNLLLSFFNIKDINISDLEYFSDNDKPIENKRTTKIIFT